VGDRIITEGHENLQQNNEKN